MSFIGKTHPMTKSTMASPNFHSIFKLQVRLTGKITGYRFFIQPKCPLPEKTHPMTKSTTENPNLNSFFQLDVRLTGKITGYRFFIYSKCPLPEKLALRLK